MADRNPVNLGLLKIAKQLLMIVYTCKRRRSGVDVVRQRASPTQEGEQDAVVDDAGRRGPEVARRR